MRKQKRELDLKTQMGNCMVSTVDLLGVDHNYSDVGPALIYETMIFACDNYGEIISYSDLYCARYPTQKAAEEGHKDVCDALASGKTPQDLSGED